MSDDQQNPEEGLAPVPEFKLTSERYEELKEALQVLYIKGNLGGRINFTKEWPDPARYVLGAELIGFDTDGATDKDRREALEEEAEDRRIELLQTVETLENKSVYEGALQTEYVEPLVKKLGRTLALLMYSDRIVDRFIPPAPGEAPRPPPVEVEAASALAQEEREPPPPETMSEPLPLPEGQLSASDQQSAAEELPPAPVPEPPDDVKPISLDEPAAAPPPEPPPAPAPPPEPPPLPPEVPQAAPEPPPVPQAPPEPPPVEAKPVDVAPPPPPVQPPPTEPVAPPPPPPPAAPDNSFLKPELEPLDEAPLKLEEDEEENKTPPPPPPTDQGQA